MTGHHFISISTEGKQSIENAMRSALSEIGISFTGEIILEQPAESSRGDLASPIALQLIKSLTPEQREQFRTPLQLAEVLADSVRAQLESSTKPIVSEVQAALPGFINFRFASSLLIEAALQLVDTAASAHAAAGSSTSESNGSPAGEGSSDIIIEYVSPNTNKPLHVGHLRNAALGNSLSKLLAAGGQQVTRAIIFNDRGLHIMKSCWGYLVAGRTGSAWLSELKAGVINQTLVSAIESQNLSAFSWQEAVEHWNTEPSHWLSPDQMEHSRLRKSDHFIGFWYQLAEQFAEHEAVAAQWGEMLRALEDNSHQLHTRLKALWQTMNNWFYAGFEQSRQRFGFGFDQSAVSYESSIYQKGKDLVLAAADQGIFERLPDGAVTARLESFGLPDKILLRRDGTGIYMTFDIELTRQRTASNAKRLMWIVGVDQQLYFKQLFAVAEMLGYGERSRYHHLAHSMVRLPDGKMSSRKGRVLYGDDILDAAVSQAKAIMEESGSREHLAEGEFEQVAQSVGIGAVKWTMLSVDPVSEITFDVETSVSFKGFAGPYVQYTNARAQSVLRQSKTAITIDIDAVRNILTNSNNLQINDAELAVLRTLTSYFDAVERSGQLYSPHILCNYLYELCQHFNSFYAVCPIMSDSSLQPERKELRLLITRATTAALREGMELLGITPVERM